MFAVQSLIEVDVIVRRLCTARRMRRVGEVMLANCQPAEHDATKTIATDDLTASAALTEE